MFAFFARAVQKPQHAIENISKQLPPPSFSSPLFGSKWWAITFSLREKNHNKKSFILSPLSATSKLWKKHRAKGRIKVFVSSIIGTILNYCIYVCIFPIKTIRTRCMREAHKYVKIARALQDRWHGRRTIHNVLDLWLLLLSSWISISNRFERSIRTIKKRAQIFRSRNTKISTRKRGG